MWFDLIFCIWFWFVLLCVWAGNWEPLISHSVHIIIFVYIFKWFWVISISSQQWLTFYSIYWRCETNICTFHFPAMQNGRSKSNNCRCIRFSLHSKQNEILHSERKYAIFVRYKYEDVVATLVTANHNKKSMWNE